MGLGSGVNRIATEPRRLVTHVEETSERGMTGALGRDEKLQLMQQTASGRLGID